jgi:CRISPR-associated protein Cas2
MPYCIAVYDVKAKRAARVLKLFRRYLHHVQRSVFEGSLTNRQKDELLAEARKVFHPEQDTLIFYETAHPGLIRREILGKELYPFTNIL